jgi:CheY-like chemotaxis protein
MRLNKRILVAEDEQGIATMMREVLERAGYTVRTVFDGHEALANYRTYRPDLILLDVMMPKENGYRVARVIKSLARVNPELKEPVILLLTGRRLDHDRERESTMMLYSKADAVLSKPFTTKELIDQVEALLSEAATTAA